MSDTKQEQGQKPQRPATRLVVATRRGYFGNAIHDPDGAPKEREAFVVPADAKASWFVDAPKAAKATEPDIG